VVAVGDGFLALGYVKRGCEESTFSTANGILLQRLA